VESLTDIVGENGQYGTIPSLTASVSDFHVSIGVDAQKRRKISISRTRIDALWGGWMEGAVVHIRDGHIRTPTGQVDITGLNVDVRGTIGSPHVRGIIVEMNVTPWHVPSTPPIAFSDIIAIIG
jgi:hypothetical protein